ncbi:hypothetical protein [Sphingopyxis sp.]|uniref:hypothetical protein n=1 Tax=Sphingopyxis sp. TaxID=1908224 RepID=UPI003D6CA962
MTENSNFNKVMVAVSVFCLFISVMYIRYNYDSFNIADYDAYAYFTDVYWSGFDRSWILSEPFGWGSLLALRWVTGSTHYAIVAAHWLLSLTTCAAILLLSYRYRLKWQGVMMSIAMFGPLLAIVTIRATPAYLLCVGAALLAARGSLFALALVGLAILFHNTAILALIPILLILFQNKFPNSVKIFENKTVIIVASAITGLIFLFYRQDLFNLFENIIAIAPGFMQKYVVYFTSGGSEAAVNAAREPTSLFHIFFIAGATLMFTLYIFLSGEEQRTYRLFAISSFAIYIVLSTNPVTSFRQSIFWIIPILLTFPWEKLRPTPAVSLGVIAFSLVVLPIGLGSVILSY